jgi:hypothetical protein
MANKSPQIPHFAVMGSFPFAIFTDFKVRRYNGSAGECKSSIGIGPGH